MKVSALPAAGNLPPGPPWPGQGDYGNGFSGGTWQLLHADSERPINTKEERVTDATQSSGRINEQVKWRERRVTRRRRQLCALTWGVGAFEPPPSSSADLRDSVFHTASSASTDLIRTTELWLTPYIVFLWKKTACEGGRAAIFVFRRRIMKQVQGEQEKCLQST